MDPASFPWPQVGVGSGWALVAFCVWLILTGRLVPKATADEYRTSSQLKDQQLLEKDIQLRHMEELGRNFDQLMRTLQARAKDGL